LFGFVMMIYVLILPYLAFGPFAPRLQADVYGHCQGTWWGQLLFINNWYPWYTTSGGCMGWAWYLGLDMTLAIVGMILLNVWKRNHLVGWLVAGGLCVASLAFTAQQAAYWNITYDVFNLKQFSAYGRYLSARSWHRYPGFCVGLMAPWALDALEKRGLTRGSQPTSIKARVIVYLACLGACATLAAVMLLPYTNTSGPGVHAKVCDDFACWSKPVTVLFITFNRPIWCMALLVLTLACYFDYLPLINRTLSASFWTPLSNLTYGCYLIHPCIIKLLAGNTWDYYTYSPADAISRACLNATLAYCAAICLWCLVEKPCATMTTWLVPSKAKSQAKSSSAAAGTNPQQHGTNGSSADENTKAATGMLKQHLAGPHGLDAC